MNLVPRMSPFLLISSLTAAGVLTACSTHHVPESFSSVPIDAGRISAITRTLASDEFEGRAPGSNGEAKTIAYLAEQFREAGLEPAGENGTYLQSVPLIRTQLQTSGSIAFDRGGKHTSLQVPHDVYLSTVRDTESIRFADVPMVFVGYGVSAPERQWDDFKDADLKGKVAIFLVNDPDFEAASNEPVANRFGGAAMTYYGRWSYKFEEAARRGAIAALVIHETAGAGYGWNTVEAPGSEDLSVELKPGAAQPVLLQGWMQRPVAEQLFRDAGLEFETVKRQARSTAFRPIPLGATLTASFDVRTIRFESHNLLGKITGSKRPDETIWFASHWDAYGIGAPDERGRRIRPGALDDASGVAGTLEIARAFKSKPRPERTIVFAAWTAEERGLLGATYYATNPTFSHEKTVANLTLDTLQPNGFARDVVLIGKGQNELEDLLVEAAAQQNRTVTPDSKPERGLFYRADHFAFARRGVPVLLIMALGGGVDLVNGGREAGNRWVSEFTANCYHQACDEWRADMDFRGAAQDVALLYAIGRKLANGSQWPEWRTDSEFAALRAESSAARR
jgi:Zn-dependent M28 family amino/carboxypeptidase